MNKSRVVFTVGAVLISATPAMSFLFPHEEALAINPPDVRSWDCEFLESGQDFFLWDVMNYLEKIGEVA
jgi:hypothetical protein